MNPPLRLMGVFAHPDDETLGFGPTLARYAAEGVETSILCATRGQKGWKLGAHPGFEEVARQRCRELLAATEVLGVRRLRQLDYMDGELDRASPREIISEIAAFLRDVRPQVVVTFGPDGAYGHRDHIAVSQFTQAAVVEAAAGHGSLPGHDAPHRVSKLYYLADGRQAVRRYQRAFGDLRAVVGGVTRRFAGWDEWALTTEVDTLGQLDTLWRAIACYRSQLRDHEALESLPKAERRAIFGRQTFYRAFSFVNAGHGREDDLFAGLREDRTSSLRSRCRSQGPSCCSRKEGTGVACQLA